MHYRILYNSSQGTSFVMAIRIDNQIYLGGTYSLLTSKVFIIGVDASNGNALDDNIRVGKRLIVIH